ncbi:MmgE/PrpD family protein [Thermaurantiacus sp.]
MPPVRARGSATDRLVAFAAAPGQLPPETDSMLRLLLRDTRAVGMAGTWHPDAARVIRVARSWGEAGPGDGAPLFGDNPGPALPPPAAAFANAFLIHALEWDAVHEPAVVHAMSAVVATAQATAPLARDRSEAAMLRSIAVGVEAACLLGVAATGPLRFFRPATAGAVGAALAAGHLLGLDEPELRHALGLGVAQASGTMQAHVEGSVALPLQVGFAARAGVSAALLAAGGLEAPRNALEGPFGYFPLFDEGSLASHIDGLGERWRIGEISIKPWPCGRASHGVLEAIARVRAAHPGAEILRIEAAVPPLVMRLVGRPWREDMPASHARLCLPFLAALMLRDGHIDPRAFTPRNFADGALRKLGARLSLEQDGNPDPNALVPQRVRLTLSGGTGVELGLQAVLGSPAAPLESARHDAKIALCHALAAAARDGHQGATMAAKDQS